MTGKRGFSLLEVLIAMAILAIGVFGAMKMFPMSLRQVRAAHERTVVTEMADDRFARLRTAGGRNLSFSTEEVLSLPGVFHREEAAEETGLYRAYHTTLSRVQGASEVYLHRATFTVRMPDGREERFATYIAEP